jgi:hypothetical protein
VEPLPRRHVPSLSNIVARAANMNRTDTETPVVRTTTQARDAVTGQGVRYVLLWSTLAVVVIFAALWLFYFH